MPPRADTFAEAQQRAARGGCLCRVCGAELPLAAALTLWQGGALAFAICAGCVDAREVVVKRGAEGIEIHARATQRVVLATTIPATALAPPLGVRRRA